jgi:hypothetical protein
MTATQHPRPYKRAPLTDEQIEQLRLDLPDEPIKLQQGWLACRTCGVATSTSDLPETSVIDVESRGQAVEGPAALTMAASQQQRVPR